MKIKIKTNTKFLEKAIIEADTINNKKVNVGIPADSKQAYIAGIHEWGTNIAVTDEIRKRFMSQGYPLKESTTQIVIPESSFFRTGMEEKGQQIIKNYGKVIPKVLLGDMSAKAFLNGLGTELSTAIKEYAVSLKSPTNSDFTTKRKGNSNSLVDTESMIDSISYKIE